MLLQFPIPWKIMPRPTTAAYEAPMVWRGVSFGCNNDVFCVTYWAGTSVSQ